MAVCGLDIDFTLTRPAHPATDPANFIKHSGVFKRMLVKYKLDISDIICATALIEQQLMEEDTAKFVDSLKKLALVLGLTGGDALLGPRRRENLVFLGIN